MSDDLELLPPPKSSDSDLLPPPSKSKEALKGATSQVKTWIS